MRKLWVFCIPMVLFIASCAGEQKPEGLIGEDVYIDLLVEFQIIKSQSYIEPGLQLDSLRMQALAYHGVSKEDFIRSHDYYQTEGEAQVLRIEKAIERVTALQAAVQEAEEE
jgi:hypothetical protein